MADDPRRRMSDVPLDVQVAVIATELKALARLVERHVRDSDSDIKELDKRLDRQDRRMAYVTGILAVLVFIGQLVAPIVAHFLDLPTP